MLRWSPRRTLEAIVTQAFALIVASGQTDLKRSATKQAQSKASNCRAVTHARGGSFLVREGGSADQKSCGGQVGGKAAVDRLFALELNAVAFIR
jgi:hypothetical protein